MNNLVNAKAVWNQVLKVAFYAHCYIILK